MDWFNWQKKKEKKILLTPTTSCCVGLAFDFIIPSPPFAASNNKLLASLSTSRRIA